MRLYHRTTAEAAKVILSVGFRDNSGNYMSTEWLTGVFLSDVPLDANEGAKGNALLAVELNISNKELSDRYELVDDEKSYREFIIPARLINENSTIQIIDEDEDEILQELWAKRWAEQESLE